MSAGKSSLIDAAIVDAARRDLPQATPTSSRGADGPDRGEHSAPADASQALWMPYELREVATPLAVDDLALGLWRRWLRPPQVTVRLAMRPEPAFSVTAVGAEALEHWPSDWPASVVFVEVPVPILLALRERPPAQASPLALQRLEWLMAAASGVIICLPVSRPLAQASLSALMVLLETVLQRPSGPPAIRLACTLADQVLAERLLMETPSFEEMTDPYLLGSIASEIVAADMNKRRLRDAMGSSAALDLCSSFGLLTSSVSANLDLATPPGQSELQRPLRPLYPLWPRNVRLERVVPSSPARLDDWEPIGLFDCIWSTVVDEQAEGRQRVNDGMHRGPPRHRP